RTFFAFFFGFFAAFAGGFGHTDLNHQGHQEHQDLFLHELIHSWIHSLLGGLGGLGGSSFFYAAFGSACCWRELRKLMSCISTTRGLLPAWMLRTPWSMISLAKVSSLLRSASFSAIGPAMRFCRMQPYKVPVNAMARAEPMTEASPSRWRNMATW